MINIDRGLIPSTVPEEAIEDFRNHVFWCLKYLGLGKPTPLQYAMAHRLQHGPEEFQLQAGRGAGKSVLTACFASWLLLLDPNTTIMVLSATAGKATEFVSMVRNILTLVPYMKHLEPKEGTKDGAFGFNTEPRTVHGQDLSCYARGITSQITGCHADWVVPDDVEIEKNSQTVEARDNLFRKVCEIEQIRNPGKGGVRMLGTPQTLDTVYAKVTYIIFKFPAIMPDLTDPEQIANVDEYILSLEIEEGDTTHPERFPFDLLMKRKAKIGPRLFALHYRLLTSGVDELKYPLRLADLIVIDVDKEVFPTKIVWATMDPRKDIPCFGLQGDMIYKPMSISSEFIPFVETVMFIDPSGRGADETAVCIASFVNGYVVVHELLGFSGGYDEGTLKKIAKLAILYDIRHIEFEENMGDAMFGSLLQPVILSMHGPCAIKGYRVRGRKEKRILDSIEPVMAQHRLVFNTKAIKHEETQRQITRLQDKKGALAHDDRIDVLGAAVKHWEDYLSISVDALIERNEEQRIKDQHAEWASDKRRATGILQNNCSGAVRVTANGGVTVTEDKPTLAGTRRKTWGRR